ncbi:MAG: hypothetical protein Q9M89_09575 [Persephonella sp.]|nr:hypothetical protein [Persephonella sp.]
MVIKIGITLGDPAGNLQKYLQNPRENCPEAIYIIYGSTNAVKNSREDNRN